MNFDWFRYVVFASIAVFFVFDHFEKKRIKDERENLIQLKTYELLHVLNLFAAVAVTLVFFIWPNMPAIYPIVTMVFASMYGEILGKIYFRRKI